MVMQREGEGINNKKNSIFFISNLQDSLYVGLGDKQRNYYLLYII